MKFILSLFIFLSSAAFATSSLPADSLSLTNFIKDSVSRKVDSCLYQAAANTQQNPLEAVENYRSALKINIFKTDVWEAEVRTAMARLLLESEKKEGLAQLTTADLLYKKTSHITARSAVVEMLGAAYEKNGAVAEAKKAYDVLINLQREQGETVLAGNAAFNMANLYYKKQDYNNAFKYAAIAQAAYYEVCRKDSLGSIYYRIAEIKKKLKSPKLAEFYIINRALPYFSASDNLAGRRKGFDFLGNLYHEQKRLSQAKWFYLQANTLSRELKDTVSTINSLISLGVVKIAIGDMALAKKDLAEADELSRQGNYTHLMKNVKLKYSTLFKSMEVKPISSASANVQLEKGLLVQSQPTFTIFPIKGYTTVYNPAINSVSEK